ncbi:MAG: glycoside hydrolase family 2 [Clostridiaceae bacterium]|nr:glycoside hydrolase family 2 [Clostridiaceae bacterium]
MIPRNEYPRPQFVRENWTNLNGEWEFSFDNDTFDKRIIVPFAYQTRLSGINIQDYHDTVWYRRNFNVDEDLSGKRLILHFGAVDYECDVWINGEHVTNHVGGHTSFEADITEFVKIGSNEIKVRAKDDSFDLEMPRGKQYWGERSKSIFYTRTTGIWQTVWLETVNENHLARVWMTPDFDNFAVEIEYELNGDGEAELETTLFANGEEIARHIVASAGKNGGFTINVAQRGNKNWEFNEDLVWTPERPNLIDVVFKVIHGGKVTDTVKSYFGMRKVSIEGGRFMLNNRPYYQKLLLDQGYWEESLLTAPNDEAFVTDIRLAKEMGFNGVRKHQKIEDPRFLYHADKMGFIVWAEFPAAYKYSRKYVRRITDEWIEEIFRDYNHPCILVWTPLNESWGVPNIMNKKDEQSHSAAMVYITKSLDGTRPVISNDGWEHTCTDILTIHDYEHRKQVLKYRYKSLESTLEAMPAGRKMFAQGWEYQGQPIMMTEFGGISYQKSDWEGWGYSNATSDDDFAKRYHAVVSAILESPLIQGFCYTQITDVEQEINGLLTYDRKPKIDPAIIRAINNGTWTPED